ncbi:MAG TPA: hypothetical protein VJK51_05100 [Candidatus Nanoarchaeia archaeon]|nr:hypothetical protein [Candidatus Nanoarchaeia archaeon]
MTVIPYMTADDFFKDAKPCTIVEDLFKELQRQREAEGLIDMHRLRMMQDWSYLNQQIVGVEIPPREYNNS